MRRLTHEDVAQSFADKGWQLTDTYYKCNTPLSCVCDKGHNTSISWDHFKQKSKKNKGCKFCAEEKAKLSHDFVKKSFAERNLTLLSAYENSQSVLRYECDKGHKHQTTWNYFQQRRRGCAICGGKIVKQADVKRLFDKKGWTMLSSYKSSREKVKVICDQGHTHWACVSSIKRGIGCAICSKRAVTQVVAEKSFLEKGWLLLDEYQDASTPMLFLCDKGHKEQMSRSSLLQGHQCPACRVCAFKPHEPCFLYYVKFATPHHTLYKIGITRRPIKTRFHLDGKYVTSSRR